MDKLFGDFKKSTYEDWKVAAEKSLKGKPLSELSREYDGLHIEPYYSDADEAASILQNKKQNTWKIFQQMAKRLSAT